MSHSHLAIRHLVRKLELARESRDVKQPLPNWLLEFIDSVADSFEPFSGVARAGYECLQSPHGWEIAMFLGEHEMVGGAADGQVSPINFAFDVISVQASFDRIEMMRWNAFPNSHVCFEEMSDLSFLTIDGVKCGEAIRLQVHAAPPESVGPAMRQFDDGRVEIA